MSSLQRQIWSGTWPGCRSRLTFSAAVASRFNSIGQIGAPTLSRDQDQYLRRQRPRLPPDSQQCGNRIASGSQLSTSHQSLERRSSLVAVGGVLCIPMREQLRLERSSQVVYEFVEDAVLHRRRPQQLDLRRLRCRRTARRRYLHADRERQAQRHRSSGLARRRAGAPARSSHQAHRRCCCPGTGNCGTTTSPPPEHFAQSWRDSSTHPSRSCSNRSSTTPRSTCRSVRLRGADQVRSDLFGRIGDSIH